MCFFYARVSRDGTLLGWGGALVVGVGLPNAGLPGIDGGRMRLERGAAPGLHAVGDAGECGAHGGRGDATDHSDVDCGEWV